MREDLGSRRSINAFALAAIVIGSAAALILSGNQVRAQVQGGIDANTSTKAGPDSECAISKNPRDAQELFVACNTSGPGLFAARSTDGGQTWIYPDPADRTLADGDASQGPPACCDPTLAWDSFGNLYFGYLAAAAASVVILLSTDSGATFNELAVFAGSVDQPTVVATDTSAPGAPVAVWVVWNQSGTMRARGAAVTGLGAVSPFNTLQTIPDTDDCSFGDVAIGPTGVVVQACQTPAGGEGPSEIIVNTDADGLVDGNFGGAVTAAITEVGSFDFIPPQNSRSVDAEVGLAYDTYLASPRYGRLYLVYTEEVTPENDDTDIMLRFSEDDGVTWSTPVRVNDDPAPPIRSQFLPRIAINAFSGNVSVCWHDARNSVSNTETEVFCSIATPHATVPTFLPNAPVSDGASTSTGAGIEFGDYSGLTYSRGIAHPAWADTSNSTGDNPDVTTDFDAYSDRVTGGAAAEEGAVRAFDYTAKVVCGTQDLPAFGRRLEIGRYATSVNILNPNSVPVSLSKTLALAGPGTWGTWTLSEFELPGPVLAVDDAVLEPGEALMADCEELFRLTGLPVFEGFLRIESTDRLSVASVYSTNPIGAAPNSRRAPSIDVEAIAGTDRRLEGDVSLETNFPTLVGLRCGNAPISTQSLSYETNVTNRGFVPVENINIEDRFHWGNFVLIDVLEQTYEVSHGGSSTKVQDEVGTGQGTAIYDVVIPWLGHGETATISRFVNIDVLANAVDVGAVPAFAYNTVTANVVGDPNVQNNLFRRSFNPLNTKACQFH